MKENRQNQNNKKERSMTARIILAVLLIIILIFGYRCSTLEDNDKSGNEVSVLEYEDEVDAITKLDISERQEAVDTLVEEGMMNVNYSPKAVFQGKVSESFNIKNIENNHGPIMFEIFDEDDNSIYRSKMIAQGYEMNCIKLNTELERGMHDCTIKVRYADAGNIVAAFPITIEVK